MALSDYDTWKGGFKHMPEDVPTRCECCGKKAPLKAHYDRGERKEVYLCAPCAVGQGFIEEPEENTDE